MVEYNILTQMAFDWKLVVYIFLGGLSGGLYFFTIAANYWKTEFKPMAKTISIATPICVAVGMIVLLFDLGNPLRAWRLFLSFHPSSAISWGVLFLNIFFIISLIYAIVLKVSGEQKAKLLGYAGLPFAFLVATYTGRLLSQAPGKVLYQNSILAWLFLIGGLISAMAVIIIISAGKHDKELISKIGRFSAWLVLLEVAMVFSEMFVLVNSGTEALRTVRGLLLGEWSALFWVLEIIVGAAIPAIIFFLGKSAPRVTQYIASVFLLVGIFVMRYIVVIGGQLI